MRTNERRTAENRTNQGLGKSELQARRNDFEHGGASKTSVTFQPFVIQTFNSQSAALRLTIKYWCLKNSFKILFYGPNGMPEGVKEIDPT